MKTNTYNRSNWNKTWWKYCLRQTNNNTFHSRRSQSALQTHEPGVISSATETWLSLDGYLAPCFSSRWRQEHHQAGTVRVQDSMILQWELHHSSGKWKLGLILILTTQGATMWAKHLNMHKMLYLKFKWLDVKRWKSNSCMLVFSSFWLKSKKTAARQRIKTSEPAWGLQINFLSFHRAEGSGFLSPGSAALSRWSLG